MIWLRGMNVMYVSTLIVSDHYRYARLSSSWIYHFGKILSCDAHVFPV